MLRMLPLVLATSAGLALLSGCGMPRANTDVHVRPSTQSQDRVIDAARIQRLSAKTAWDAVRILIPTMQFGTAPERGVGTVWNAGTAPQQDISAPRLVINGNEVDDAHVLRTISAADVVSIELLDTFQSVVRLGSRFRNGAVLVRTTGAPFE